MHHCVNAAKSAGRGGQYSARVADKLLAAAQESLAPIYNQYSVIDRDLSERSTNTGSAKAAWLRRCPVKRVLGRRLKRWDFAKTRSAGDSSAASTDS